MAYTYKDFTDYLAKSGLTGDQFSIYDMALAQKFPDQGMALIDNKLKAIKSPADADIYNQYANNIRSSYGGYTGGSAGADYNANAVPDNSSAIKTAAGKVSSFPDYVSSVEKPKDTITDFDKNYNVYNSPVYQAYAKQYTREGKRAMADTLGAVAGMTGGIPSSYAVGAGQQAYNNYAAQLSDKIPDIYNQAYNQALSAYQTNLGQFNADRSFDYGTYTDKYGRTQDAFNNAIAQGDQDLTRWNYQNALTQQNYTNRTTEQATEWSRAIDAANAGDYSLLKALGVDTTNAETLYSLGVTGAQLDNQTKQAGIDNTIASTQNIYNNIANSNKPSASVSSTAQTPQQTTNYYAYRTMLGGMSKEEAQKYLQDNSEEIAANLGDKYFKQIYADFFDAETEKTETEDVNGLMYSAIAELKTPEERAAWLSENSQYMTDDQIKYAQSSIANADKAYSTQTDDVYSTMVERKKKFDAIKEAEKTAAAEAETDKKKKTDASDKLKTVSIDGDTAAVQYLLSMNLPIETDKQLVAKAGISMATYRYFAEKAGKITVTPVK